MSHYTELETEFKDKDCLVKALQDMGYHPEVGEQLSLYGYQGDVRPQKASIVIRRKEVGSASNDIGFVYDKSTKSYRQIISEFDTGQKRMRLSQLKKAYAPHVVKKLARVNRFRIVRRKEKDGEVRLLLRR